MRKLHVFLLSTAVLLPAAPALADGISIAVTPYLAANNFGSPSATQLNANAANGLYHGQTTYGSAGPTQFNAQPNITSAQGVVTNFSSFQGVAEPGGAYANELGNRQTFAVAIYGNGTEFSISQLSYSISSTDGNDAFAGSHAAGYYQYGQNSYGGATGLSDYIGVLAGPDGVVGTADDIFITSGPSTQMVDALFGSGSGSSFQALCSGCTKDQEQEAIYDQAAYYPGFPYTITGTYTVQGISGSGTFNVTPYDAVVATPEPSGFFLLGTGVAGLVGGMRRRLARRTRTL